MKEEEELVEGIKITFAQDSAVFITKDNKGDIDLTDYCLVTPEYYKEISNIKPNLYKVFLDMVEKDLR